MKHTTFHSQKRGQIRLTWPVQIRWLLNPVALFLQNVPCNNNHEQTLNMIFQSLKNHLITLDMCTLSPIFALLLKLELNPTQPTFTTGRKFRVGWDGMNLQFSLMAECDVSLLQVVSHLPYQLPKHVFIQGESARLELHVLHRTACWMPFFPLAVSTYS